MLTRIRKQRTNRTSEDTFVVPPSSGVRRSCRLKAELRTKVLAVDFRRRGSVLLLVLVVIALLTLGAYSFSELMVTESQATSIYGREAQARACADSGVEFATAILGQVAEDAIYDNVLHDPQHFAGVLLRESDSPRGRARFSLVAANESDSTGSTIRFGLIDESSKLNLNSLTAQEKQQDKQSLTAGTTGSSATSSGSSTPSGSSTSTGNSTPTGSSGSSNNSTGSTSTTGSSTSSTSSSSTASTSTPTGRLMAIPGMTDELADAILDFIDDDDTPRANGCESEYYESLSPPYAAKNGRLDSLDELLLVRGVTPEMLYGEDANRNGLLDPNENDGAASWPPDDEDGTLLLGWSAYLTVFGREKNLQFDNTERININDNNLGDLYDKLAQTFDANVAQFVVAYRSNSGQSQSGTNSNTGGSNSTPSSGGNNVGSGGGGAPSGGGNSQQSNSGSAGSTSSQQIQQLQQAAQTLGNAVGGGNGTVTRAGIDLSKGATRQVQSIYEMIGVEVQATVNGSAQTLKSPWGANGTEMAGYLPQLFDTLSLSTDQFLEGRININQARRETLMTIPGVTESIADSIVAARMGPDGSPSVDLTGSRATAGWLVIENLVDLNTMKTLDRYMTARGGVYRVQSVGFFDEAGPFTRLEAVIDLTESNKPPVVISLHDLSALGRGYPPKMLMGGTP